MGCPATPRLGGGWGWESVQLSVFPPLGRKLLAFTWNAVLVSLSISVYPGMLPDLTELGLTHHELRWRLSEHRRIRFTLLKAVECKHQPKQP